MLCRVALRTQMVKQRINFFFFTSCGSLIPYTRANAQWVIHGFNQHYNLHFRVNSLFHHLISSLANYRPFFRSFGHIPPSEEFRQVSSLVCKTRRHQYPPAKCLFAQKLGLNLSEMEGRTFLRIKKVICDHLLAFQAEIIKGKLYSAVFQFCV